jgi:isopenicillin N synthase-like dioxygenase
MKIPMIDLAPLITDDATGRHSVSRAIDHAAREAGFLYLKQPLLTDADHARMAAIARDFFGRSDAHKLRYAFDEALNFGYGAIGGEGLDPYKPKDLKETFTMRDVEGHCQDAARWPDPRFRAASVAFYRQCRRICGYVMEAFARSLDLEPRFFDDKHTGKTQTLRLLHYPPSEPAAPDQLGAGAHTDYGSCTLVFQDNAGGLEVQAFDGSWIAAPPIPGTVVVNTGDLLARWTNDIYRSTPHRVRVRPGDARDGRLSIAFFNDPDPEVWVEALPSCVTQARPRKYPPITAHEHILERIALSNR